MKTERMARLLARRLEEGERTGAEAEVSVGDLLERYVPYRAARRALELTTKSEYDLLVLEFLADRRLTVLDDPEVAEAAARELDTPEPGLGPLEEHADAALRLDLASISGGYSGGGSRSGGDDEAGGEGRSGAAADGSEGAWDPTGGVEARPADLPTADADVAETAGTGDVDEAAETDDVDEAYDTDDTDDVDGGPEGEEPGDEEESDCRRCGEPLPVDAEVPVRFCPHCGTSRPERACPECDTALEPGWTYCPACGARASPSGGGAA